MTKPTIIKTWLVGLVVVLAGAAIGAIATGVWLAHVVSVTGSGSSYVPDNFFWTTVAFWWGSGIVAVAGILVQVAAWIGAVVNTHRLEDKTWFNLLLWVGMIGILTSPAFGVGAMAWWGVTIAYLIAGPDGMAVEHLQTATPAAPPTKLAPTG
jgi:hypothetical protein